MEWRTPATGDDFEHDVSGSHSSAIVLLVLVCILGVALVVWTPSDVVVPLWLVLLIVLVFLFFPLRWSLRRPWTVVAETGDDGDGEPTEKWVGTVRGVFNVRAQVNKIARTIADESSPGIEGPLRLVD
jgi:hypothetical protein